MKSGHADKLKSGNRNSASVLPIKRAAALYKADNRNFLDVVQDHLDNGIVIDQPDCFALGKAVQLEDGRFAWIVNAAAGNLRALVRHIPWFLPWVAFYRRGRINQSDPANKCGRMRVYPLKKFSERVSGRLSDCLQISSSINHSITQ